MDSRIPKEKWATGGLITGTGGFGLITSLDSEKWHFRKPFLGSNLNYLSGFPPSGNIVTEESSRYKEGSAP